MADGIKRTHAGREQRRAARDSQADVDEAEQPRRVGNARTEARILGWTRCIGAVLLHATDTEQRQNRNAHDDQAMPPSQLSALRQRLTACGRKSSPVSTVAPF